jgi:hypothetical protein
MLDDTHLILSYRQSPHTTIDLAEIHLRWKMCLGDSAKVDICEAIQELQIKVPKKPHTCTHLILRYCK